MAREWRTCVKKIDDISEGDIEIFVAKKQYRLEIKFKKGGDYGKKFAAFSKSD